VSTFDAATLANIVEETNVWTWTDRFAASSRHKTA
jgi:hypothetical protein